jgi:hypothetical protein
LVSYHISTQCYNPEDHDINDRKDGKKEKEKEGLWDE